MRLISKLNRQDFPQITNQVSVAVLDHIKGISDFGLNWALNAALMVERFLRNFQHISLYSEALKIIDENQKVRLFSILSRNVFLKKTTLLLMLITESGIFKKYLINL